MFGFLTQKTNDNGKKFEERIDQLERLTRQLLRENAELRLDMDNLREKVMRKMSGAGRPPKTDNDMNDLNRSGVIPWPQSS